MRFTSSLRFACEGVGVDQEFMLRLAPAVFRQRSTLRALLTNDSLRAAFLMRMAASGGLLGRFARSLLISGFSCDVAAGTKILGALHLPHPIGIVLGSGVVLRGDVSIFQHVTVGSNGAGQYPSIGKGVRLFPQAVVVGGVTVGDGARIGSGVFVSVDVAPKEVMKRVD